MNDVKNLNIAGLTEAAKESWLNRLKRDILEYNAPELGHAQAGTLPDEPYREWNYENCEGKKFDISNVERSLDASQSCYQVLRKFLEQFSGFAIKSVVPWHDIVGNISLLFQKSGSLNNRTKAWKKAIAESGLGFKPEGRDINLDYDEKEWFTEAVKVKVSKNEKKYTRNSGFETSNWRYFQAAAAFHRFTVLHEVLPEHGMICG